VAEQPAAAGHRTRDEQAVRQFVERFAAVLSQAGIPLMPARVFVALLTADAPRLTADDIARVLQVSPAAVSGAVRYLIPVGLVIRETEPGSRRYWYRMPRDVWHEVVRLRDQMMMRWSQTLRDGLDLFDPGSLAGERIGESIMYFDFVQKELPMVLSRWEEYRDTHQG
jgi:predicted transcriptional regulator